VNKTMHSNNSDGKVSRPRGGWEVGVHCGLIARWQRNNARVHRWTSHVDSGGHRLTKCGPVGLGLGVDMDKHSHGNKDADQCQNSNEHGQPTDDD